MKKSLSVIIGGAIIVGGLLTACGEAEVSKVDKDTEEAVTASTEETTETETQEEATEEAIEEEGLVIGDTVQFNDLLVTINSVRRYDGDADNWEEPENDYFLIFDVAIENTSDEAATISSLMQFDLLDSDSYSQEMSMFVKTKGSLDGEIGAGRKMAGEIAFDVEDSDYYEFIFEDVFTTGQAIWMTNKVDFE